eukprot:TRINITY_DN7850_c0_g1_i1.p1 TRINITY_DN7850_c0_g1~~TRINITY_DN7850_c0_g1_i1.p1  ORF type:complete len:435 (-),score=67.94 TRINITY_DN7850_c0_g1_i1:17-1321(-)
MKKIYSNVPIRPPLEKYRKIECSKEDSSLFTTFPTLRDKIAWVKLGDFPTPVEQISLGKFSFYLKREDLSSKIYGGNKVRTLEFQLPCVASAGESTRKQSGAKTNVMAFGAPGSNQVIATFAHIANNQLLSEDLCPVAIYMLPEASNAENGANLLSTLSFPGKYIFSFASNIGILTGILHLTKLLFFSLDGSNGKTQYVMPGGGANPAGALGHVGAALELAGQIERKDCKDIDHIFVPLGSGCTTSGLIVGICLARKLNKKAYHKSTIIHSVPIHPLLTATFTGRGFMVKMTVKELAVDTAKLIKKLVDVDVIDEVRTFLKEEWIIEKGWTGGEYGKASKEGISVRQLFKTTGQVESASQTPWFCYTFSSKALACLLSQLENQTIQQSESIMFWCTKSVHQPTGDLKPQTNLKKQTESNVTLVEEFVRKCGMWK